MSKVSGCFRTSAGPVDTFTRYQVELFVVERLGFLRGRSQYGLLHLGQTVGVSWFCLGSHWCPQRSHSKPERTTFATDSTILAGVLPSIV